MTRRTATILGWGSFAVAWPAFISAIALALAAAPYEPPGERLTLEALDDELIDVVSKTRHRTHASVWLAQGARS